MHTGNLFRKNLQLKDVCYSRLKATKNTGQRKAFYRQRIPQSSCARKKAVDIDILVTSRNVTEKSRNLSEQRVNLPCEKGSGTS